jgi:hypothetical protein
VRDGLDLPFEGTGDFDQIQWDIWKQQLTRLEELGANGCQLRDKTESLVYNPLKNLNWEFQGNTQGFTL